MRSLALAAVVVLVLPLLVAPEARAQGVGSLLGSLGSGDRVGSPVDDEAEARALETARRVFEREADALAERIVRSEAPGGGGSVESLEPDLREALRNFTDRAHAELDRRKRDGLLTRAELSEALGDARDQAEDGLQEALRAAVHGADPPPERSAGETTWSHVVELARYALVERNPAWHWGICATLLVLGLLGAGILSRGLVRLARRLEEGRATRSLARAAEELAGPLYLAGAALAVRLGLEWIWLPFDFAEASTAISTALLGIAALWLAWSSATGLATTFARASVRAHGRIDDEAVDLIRKGLRLGALALFAVFIVDALFGLEPTSVFATVGVLGVVASIAAQDTLRNLMAGFTIHGDQPFVMGDLIRVRGHLGSVEDIGLRSTRVRTLDGHRVTLPNAEVVREAVENVGDRPYVRHHYDIDLVYATPPDRVRRAVEILEEILEAAEPPAEHPPHVSFEAFAPYSLRLTVWYFSNTSDWWEARARRTDVNLQILERFEAEGLRFAFPTAEIHFPADAEANDEEELTRDGDEQRRADED